MKRTLSNQFLTNYVIVFLLSIVAAFSMFLMLSFADSMISKTLMKNRYPAATMMQEDYRQIQTDPITQNGGGVQIIDRQYRVVYSQGINTIGKQQLSVAEFTDFLIRSKQQDTPYHYDIAYHEQSEYWLIVTFPTSLRMNLSFVYNKEAASKDMKQVSAVLLAVLLFYLLLLAISTVVYARITARGITRPLRKLSEAARLLKEGDYTARVNLHLKNEFAQLQDTFNDMAVRIEHEMTLRRQSEEERRKLILDVSHDLKNPLASVVGYAQLCLQNTELSTKQQTEYLQIIVNNSQRANRLLSELFLLSKIESPGFTLKLQALDVCEYLRQQCIEMMPMWEQAGFAYEFIIPQQPLFAMLDPEQFSRVLHNLSENAVLHNQGHTTITIELWQKKDQIIIVFQDSGIGIPKELANEVFKPFVRVDHARNSATGGSGLGLSIAHKIITAHRGTITLQTDTGQGCLFTISIPCN